MKKVLFLLTVITTVFFASCSSDSSKNGYDEKTCEDLLRKFDRLDPDEAIPENDCRTAIKQLSFILDDYDKVDDPEDFMRKHRKEAALFESLYICMLGEDNSGNLSYDLEKEFDKIKRRFGKLTDKLEPRQIDYSYYDDTDDYDYSFDEVEWETPDYSFEEVEVAVPEYEEPDFDYDFSYDY